MPHTPDAGPRPEQKPQPFRNWTEFIKGSRGQTIAISHNSGNTWRYARAESGGPAKLQPFGNEPTETGISTNDAYGPDGIGSYSSITKKDFQNREFAVRLATEDEVRGIRFYGDRPPKESAR